MSKEDTVQITMGMENLGITRETVSKEIQLDGVDKDALIQALAEEVLFYAWFLYRNDPMMKDPFLSWTTQTVIEAQLKMIKYYDKESPGCYSPKEGVDPKNLL